MLENTMTWINNMQLSLDDALDQKEEILPKLKRQHEGRTRRARRQDQVQPSHATPIHRNPTESRLAYEHIITF